MLQDEKYKENSQVMRLKCLTFFNIAQLMGWYLLLGI